MSDLPPGEWSEILVGHQWPGEDSLATLEGAELNRTQMGKTFEAYAALIQSVRTGPLAEQEGVTAEDTRDAFRTGEQHAIALADKQHAIKSSYSTARNTASSLRSELSEIAARGNAEIRQIGNSKEPAPAKLAKIIEAVIRAQTEANTRAGSACGNLYDAIQRVLEKNDTGPSAREFAAAHGVNLGRFGSPDPNAVRDQVVKMLDNKQQHPGLQNFSAGNRYTAAEDVPSQAGAVHALGGADIAPPSENRYTTPEPVEVNPTSSSVMPGTRYATGSDSGGLPAVTGNPTVSTAPTVAGAGLASPSVTSTAGSSVATPQGTPALPHPTLPSTPTNALSPEGFAQNFNSGAQTGNPMSAGTEALSNSAAHAMQPQAPIHPESMAAPPMAPTTPTAGAPLFETAHTATTYDTAQAPAAPPPDTTQTYVAAPAAQAAPVMPSTAAPVAAQGPLPAYGADLRPPAATAPASPAPMPTGAAPASAPVHPSSASQLNQPAVVRQAPVSAGTPAAAPTGITENAVAATTTGAMTGASAAQTQAQRRLNRLLDAVARQEPKLRWAIGDREDGNTVLATDLASGWIPPHVEIPTGIKLLKPGHRSRTLDALLGETTLTATYSPGHYVPPAEDAEPVSMSIRARDTHDVDDLGWELSQATKWRDGLPRLAHTLAKAASTGTGYLDSEVELLREHLANVAQQVLTDYPEHVDAAKVGNWQLLATINALIKGEKTAANYHFAWFQALNLALKGGVHR